MWSESARDRRFLEYFSGCALDQAAGGGRTKFDKTGLNTENSSLAKRAIATGRVIGKTLTNVAAGPRLGTEQIEHE